MRTVQDVCLALFEEFIRVCKFFDLNWFADSGTLLGAIRKGKLIPWDDDVDVIMPRKDYDILCKIGKDAFHKPFFFQTPMTDRMFEIHAKLRMDGTTSITPREKNGFHHKGMFLDIFPLDAVPDDENELNALIGFLRTIGRYSSLRDIYSSYPNVSAFQTFYTMNDILADNTIRNANSKYIGNVVFYRYSDYQYAKFTRAAYSDYELKQFENLSEKIRVPVGYEEILKVWYGDDWMIEKQVQTAHNAIVNPNKDFKEYLLSI